MSSAVLGFLRKRNHTTSRFLDNKHMPARVVGVDGRDRPNTSEQADTVEHRKRLNRKHQASSKRRQADKLRIQKFNPFQTHELVQLEAVARGYVTKTKGSEYTIGPITVLRLLATVETMLAAVPPAAPTFERGMRVRLRNPGASQPQGVGVIQGRPSIKSVMTRVAWCDENDVYDVYLDQLVEVKN